MYDLSQQQLCVSSAEMRQHKLPAMISERDSYIPKKSAILVPIVNLNLMTMISSYWAASSNWKYSMIYKKIRLDVLLLLLTN